MKPTPPKKQAAHQKKAKQQASHTMILIKNKYHATLFTQVKACQFEGRKIIRNFKYIY